MNLTNAKQKFFRENPNAYAHFCYNERMGKYLCFTYDYQGDSTQKQYISDELKQKIFDSSKNFTEEPIYFVIEYLGNHSSNDPEIASKISDFFYDNVVNSQNEFNSTDEVCDAFNKFMSKTETNTKNNSNKSYVGCYVVNEDLSLDENRIFYMELIFAKNKQGQSACKIENTFTDEEFRGKGIHSYAIKFLEAVLARKNVYTLIGESKECDAYQSENNASLENHYENLGFMVRTDNSGKNLIVKDIDPNFEMEITGSSLEKIK